LISRYSWSKYYLFTNTDLSQYLTDSPIVKGMTLQFSIIVLIVYFIVFNLLSWSIFQKRDVAA
jgi:ABC-2 type transport system permease protein